MPERPVGVTDTAGPASATVAQVRTRERVIGTDTVVEPFGIVVKERVVACVVTGSTFRHQARAAADQPIFYIENGAASARRVALRECVVTYETIVAKTVINPYVRLYRGTAAATGGTTLPKERTRTGDVSDANILVKGDASADGTLSATPLAWTVSGGILTSRFLGRMHTLAGISPSSGGGRIDLLDGVPQDEPIELLPGQFLGVRLMAAAALVANDWHTMIDYSFEEFTLP